MSSPVKKFKWFSDGELKNELPTDKAGIPLSTFLKTTSAGEKQNSKIYVVNETNNVFLVDSVDSADQDLTVVFSENNLRPKSPVEVNLSFHPKPDRIKRLDANFSLHGRWIF